MPYFILFFSEIKCKRRSSIRSFTLFVRGQLIPTCRIKALIPSCTSNNSTLNLNSISSKSHRAGTGPEPVCCDRQRSTSGPNPTSYGKCIALGACDAGLSYPTKFIPIISIYHWLMGFGIRTILVHLNMSEFYFPVKYFSQLVAYNNIQLYLK